MYMTAPAPRGRLRTRPRRTAVPAALAAIILVPRLVRTLYPQVWIEDESYLTGAFALSRGFLPYRDFPLPHLPLLDAAAAVLFRTAGASIRMAEGLTAIAAAAGTALVFLLGSTMAGDAAGLASALIFSTSPLLFRYHVFEREVFVVAPVVAAVLLAVKRAPSDRPRLAGLAIGMLLAIALAIKLTAVAALAGVAVYLAATRRRSTAAVAVVTALAVTGLFAAALFAKFGTDFAVQVVVFRMLHATFPSLGTKLNELRLTLDIALALGAAGIILIAWRSRRASTSSALHKGWSAVLYQVAAGVFVLVLLNPTYWAHTGIELLPWLSLCGGYLVAGVVRDSDARLCAAAAAALLVFVSPIHNLNWEAGDGSPFGFGYRDRAEIERAADYVRAHALPDEPVATPPIIAFAAQRRELVPYPELAGEMQHISEAIGRDGYRGALADPDLGRGTFWDSVEHSGRLIAPRLADAVRRREPAVVINDSADDLMPIQLIDLAPDDLRASGYSLETVVGHYDIWVRR